MHFLLTNDDGIEAIGLRALSEAALEVARENARRILGEPLSVACGDTSPQRGEARFCEEPESALGSPLWGELSAKWTERGIINRSE